MTGAIEFGALWRRGNKKVLIGREAAKRLAVAFSMGRVWLRGGLLQGAQGQRSETGIPDCDDS